MTINFFPWSRQESTPESLVVARKEAAEKRRKAEEEMMSTLDETQMRAAKGHSQLRKDWENFGKPCPPLPATPPEPNVVEKAAAKACEQFDGVKRQECILSFKKALFQSDNASKSTPTTPHESPRDSCGEKIEKRC